MELVNIFTGEKDGDVVGLFAVRYNEGQPDEFEKLFDNWSNPSWVLSYFIFNEEFLKHPYFDNYTIDDLSKKVEYESLFIQGFFLKYEIDGFAVNAETLDLIFKPLEPEIKQFENDILGKAKLVIDNPIDYPQPILRLYGLRISEDTFIITGGAIKLTHFMEHHPDTRDELHKLDNVRDWLIENEVTTQDDINYSYYEQ